MSPPSSGLLATCFTMVCCLAFSSAVLATCFTLVSFLAYSSTLKMEATCSSEMSLDFQRTTRCYIPEDRTLHNHRCENLRSCVVKQVVPILPSQARYIYDVPLGARTV
jgi:hypothetical protein